MKAFAINPLVSLRVKSSTSKPLNSVFYHVTGLVECGFRPIFPSWSHSRWRFTAGRFWHLLCPRWAAHLWHEVLNTEGMERRILFTDWTLRFNWYVNGYCMKYLNTGGRLLTGKISISFNANVLDQSQQVNIWRFGSTETTRKIQQVEFSVHCLRHGFWYLTEDYHGRKYVQVLYFVASQPTGRSSWQAMCVVGMFVGWIHLEAELCEDVLWLSLVFVTRDCEPRAATLATCRFSLLSFSVSLSHSSLWFLSSILFSRSSWSSQQSAALALYLPSALNFSRYSFASDVWSYGVTIYEAAMLVPPFRGANICQAGIKLDKKCGKKWTCQRTGSPFASFQLLLQISPDWSQYLPYPLSWLWTSIKGIQ